MIVNRHHVHVNVQQNIQGIALITVLLVVALAAVIAMQMSGRLQLQIQRATNIAFNEQAFWYALGAEAFSRRLLADTVATDPDTINLSQAWTTEATSYPVENGEISGQLIDLQSCFNLNALRGLPKTNDEQQTTKDQQQGVGRENPEKAMQNRQSTASQVPDERGRRRTLAQQAFERLLLAADLPDVGPFEAESLTDALIDWLDEDNVIVSASGAEDNDYAAKQYPYLAANHYLASVDELRLIEHFTVPVIMKLKSYVCVIPQSNQLIMNVNTITEENALLLAAILDISVTDAKQLISARPEKGFASVSDFMQLKEMAKVPDITDKNQVFSVDSDYFKLSTTARFDTSEVTLNSIFYIENNQQVRVIQRTIGKD